MSFDQRNVRALVRAVAYDVKGSRLGRVAQVFLDDRTDEPAWVAVDVTRTRGMRLLPLAGAGLKGKYLVIRADRTTVRSAPRIDLGDGQLSSQDESRLLEHYGLLPAAADPGAQYGEQRPATPWPDDSQQETAWEPFQGEPEDPQVLARGNDRTSAGAGAGAQSHERSQPPTPTPPPPPPPPQGDTAPLPTSAPSPPAPSTGSAMPAMPPGTAVRPAPAQTAPAEAGTAVAASAPSPPPEPAAPADGSNPSAAQPDSGTANSRT